MLVLAKDRVVPSPDVIAVSSQFLSFPELEPTPVSVCLSQLGNKDRWVKLSCLIPKENCDIPNSAVVRIIIIAWL